MRLSGKSALALILSLAIAGTVGVWFAAAPQANAAAAAALPGPGPFKCPPATKVPGNPKHSLLVFRLGTTPFDSIGIGGPSIEGVAEKSYVNQNGQTTVPLTITSLNVTSVAEGLGAVNYWLDTSRPAPSAIWEKTPGTGFPAVQVMSFNVFVNIEGFEGTLHTVSPATLRSNDVHGFPPPPGTAYQMVAPVNLADASGEVVGRILTGSFVMP